MALTDGALLVYAFFNTAAIVAAQFAIARLQKRIKRLERELANTLPSNNRPS